MPTQVFTSFEAYIDAIRHADMRAMILGPVRANWVLTSLVLNKLSVQWGQAGSKAVADGSPRAGGLSILIPTQRASSLWGNGKRFDECSLLVAEPGDEFSLAADVSRRWCSLHIPYPLLGAGHRDRTKADDPKRGVFQLPAERIERFRSVIGQIDEIYQREPAAFDSSAAQAAAEQRLVQEVRLLLAVTPEVESLLGRHAVPRGEIIRAAMDFVDQHEGEYLCVEQLACAAGVSERTLRDAFQQYFGAGPARYLKTRTLHQVRKALKSTDPTMTTVTEIATRFGVWHLGRFAQDYRILFHELPSETMRRPN